MKKAVNISFSILQLLISLAILGAGIWGILILMSGREKNKSVELKAQATYVEVSEIEKISKRIEIQAFGSLVAQKEMNLRSQVAGAIKDQNPKLIRGALLNKDEELIQIEKSDYQAVVSREEANLIRAQFDLKVEEGKQLVAAREWELLGNSLNKKPENEELVLRKPHLAEKEAAVKAATSALEQATLNLKRTTLKAPFNCLVQQESVEKDQYIDPQFVVARLIGTDAFHIEVSLLPGDLKWIQLPEEGKTATDVHIVSNKEAGKRDPRVGKVVGLLGEVDAMGRMARLLVQVDDPFGLKSPKKKLRRLLVGEYLEVKILGPTFNEVAAIPRSAIHEGNTVWLMDKDSKLKIVALQPLFSTNEDVIVQHNFGPQDRLVTSSIAVPTPGLQLTRLAHSSAAKDSSGKE